jgi:hypothetical protein
MNITQAHGCAAQGENKILSSFYYALNLFLPHFVVFRKDYERYLSCGHLYLLVDY